MRKYRSLIAAILISAALLLIAAITTGDLVESDSRPVFHINPNQPFRLEFGRGSGWHGLDTIRIDQNGNVVLHRHERGREWETGTLQFSPKSLNKVLEAVESNGLMKMYRTYSNPRIHDGTQWVLWIKQGESEKSVYFNNSFPHQINEFAEQLDGILQDAGLMQIKWQPVPLEQSQMHEREIWDSIK